MMWLLILSKLTFAGPMSYGDGLKTCEDSVRWGYFMQDQKVISKLGGRINLWKQSDLTGSFLSLEECNAARAKLASKKYLAEECEVKSHSNSADVVAEFYFLKGVDLRNGSEDFEAMFSSRESCDKAKHGGRFKVNADVVNVAPEGEKALLTFKGDCFTSRLPVCKKHSPRIEYTNLNE